MKINKAELQKALEKVKPALANKELIEQTTSFAFKDGRVVTYNDEISISHPVNNLDITGAIKAQALYEFLNKIKQDEIDIEWEENQLIIKAAKAKAGLVLEQEVKLPVEEIGEIQKWKPVPDDLIPALKFCNPCCSQDMSRPILTCVHVSGKAIEASDSYQIVRHSLENKIPIKPFLLPSSSVRELVKYDIKEMAEGEGWAHFKTEEGTIFSSRILSGEFPDVGKLLEFDGVDFDFPKKTLSALEKAQVFSKSAFNSGDLPTISITIIDGAINITSKNEYGWFEESVRSKHVNQGDPINFMIGIEFLVNLLSQLQACLIGEDRVKFEGENWIHVIAITAEKVSS